MERSDLSGEERVILASSPQPTSLTVDVNTERLYWLDVQDSTIFTCAVDGNNVIPLLVAPHGNFFNGLAVYGVCETYVFF